MGNYLRQKRLAAEKLNEGRGDTVCVQYHIENLKFTFLEFMNQGGKIPFDSRRSGFHSLINEDHQKVRVEMS